MREEFLHFVWRTRHFDTTDLKTTIGDPVEIVDFGHLNTGGGPDFKEGRIRIADTLWAGHIEMHLTSSEWHNHGHSNDPKYDNVILHVVLEDDRPVLRDGRPLPCIELKRRIPADLLARYQRLIQLETWVPCEHLVKDVPRVIKARLVEHMLVQRLEHQRATLLSLMKTLRYDWEEALYRLTARSFGFKHNNLAFMRLATMVPVRTIYHLGGDLHRIEALMFGTAGMLNQIFLDQYPAQLQKEYHHLSRKYSLTAMNDSAWEWGRVRPANFPVIRIAQLCALLSRAQSLLSDVLRVSDVGSLRSLFRVKASSYWDNHSNFDRPSAPRSKRLGRGSVDSILINSIIPFMFTYGKHKANDQIMERAIRMMHQLAPEKNSITRRWDQLGMPNETAGNSQALLHLKKVFCDRQLCMQCAIGAHLLLNEKARHV